MEVYIPLAWSPVGLYLNPYTHVSGRTDVSAAAKEREERVRRLREQQEDERKKKLEELKQHVRLLSKKNLKEVDDFYIYIRI